MMAARCRHPHVVVWSCRLYSLLIWFYPADLRRDYRHELQLTFRNRLEDVINAGLWTAMLFAFHIAADWFRTLAFEPEPTGTFSLLGLTSIDGGAPGSVDRSTISVSLMLASLGVVLLIGGWYWWLNYTAAILSHHQSFLSAYTFK
jgi:hypothetical protein